MQRIRAQGLGHCPGPSAASRDDSLHNAEKIEFPSQSFDVLWSIECTEHLFDKPAFFRLARRTGLSPAVGWRFVFGSPAERTDPSATQQVLDVCEGFLCPSLGTIEEYCGWLTAAGLVVTARHDWTSQVLNTWPICRQRVERTGVRWLARPTGQAMVRFLERFDAIDQAYRSGAMQYGCILARRPESPT